MARRSTGISKKINRIQGQGLDLFLGWRSAGSVSDYSEMISPAYAYELAGVVIKKEMRAIEFAVKVIKEGK